MTEERELFLNVTNAATQVANSIHKLARLWHAVRAVARAATLQLQQKVRTRVQHIDSETVLASVPTSCDAFQILMHGLMRQRLP